MPKGRKQSETFNYKDSEGTEHKILPTLFSLEDFTEAEVNRLALKAYRIEAMSDFAKDMAKIEPSLVQHALFFAQFEKAQAGKFQPEALAAMKKQFPCEWPTEWVHTVAVDKLKPEVD